MARRRHQPPAYSPVSLTSLWSGLRAALGGDAESEVLDLLAAKYSPRKIMLTDTGTTALQLAIRAALAARPGRVALPAYSCYDVSTAAEGAAARVLLCDIDPATLSPDPASLERAIRNGATVVVVAHLYGIAVDMESLTAMRDRNGLIVIEDAAQGIGATYAGRNVGSLGDLSVLSFARGKGITGGGGGALLACSETGAQALNGRPQPGPGGAGWKQLARATAAWLLARPPAYGLAASLPFLRLGETIYRQPATGSAAPRAALGVLSKTFGPSEIESEVRKKNAAELTEFLEARPGTAVLIRPPARSEAGYLRLPLLLSRELSEHDRAVARRLGVAPGYPIPLSRLETCRRICDNADDTFPGAERLSAQLVTLPTHSRHGKKDRDALLAWLRRHL